MNVVVYRRDAKLGKGGKRVVCEEPVFGAGASATENSLITTGRSIVVENNYGYQDPFGPQTGSPTEPGFARVDIKANGKGAGPCGGTPTPAPRAWCRRCRRRRA